MTYGQMLHSCPNCRRHRINGCSALSCSRGFIVDLGLLQYLHFVLKNNACGGGGTPTGAPTAAATTAAGTSAPSPPAAHEICEDSERPETDRAGDGARVVATEGVEAKWDKSLLTDLAKPLIISLISNPSFNGFDSDIAMGLPNAPLVHWCSGATALPGCSGSGHVNVLTFCLGYLDSKIWID